MENDNLLVLRDIQEIKLSLKHFTEDIVNQLSLLREILQQSSSQRVNLIKSSSEIEDSLKDFEYKIINYDKRFEEIICKLNELEERIVDKNNEEAIIVLIEEIREYSKNTEKIIIEMKNEALSNKDLSTLISSLSIIETNTNKLGNVKKNLMWWIDWLYKIGITVMLLLSFFGDKITT